jgi:hypothetical protein
MLALVVIMHLHLTAVCAVRSLKQLVAGMWAACQEDRCICTLSANTIILRISLPLRPTWSNFVLDDEILMTDWTYRYVTTLSRLHKFFRLLFERNLVWISTGLPNILVRVSLAFPHHLQSNSGIGPQSRPRPDYFASFAIHYSLSSSTDSVFKYTTNANRQHKLCSIEWYDKHGLWIGNDAENSDHDLF